MRTTFHLEPAVLDDASLPSLIARSAEPVVLASHFGGWERPWHALSAEDWHALLREFGERVNGAVLETGANRESALRFGLEIVPTVLVLLDGQVVARFTGRVSVASLVAAIREAWRERDERASSRVELEAASAAPVASPTVRRRRTVPDAPFSLARAG